MMFTLDNTFKTHLVQWDNMQNSLAVDWVRWNQNFWRFHEPGLDLDMVIREEMGITVGRRIHQ